MQHMVGFTVPTMAAQFTVALSSSIATQSVSAPPVRGIQQGSRQVAST